jgi:hypothetical protein
MHKRVPSRLAFPIGDLPIQDLSLATAIRPEPQRHQQHHFLATSLVPLATSFIWFERVCLALHTQPNAAELHYSRNIGDGFTPCLLENRLDLINPVIDRASSNATL